MAESLPVILLTGRINPRVREGLDGKFEVVTVDGDLSSLDESVIARARGIAGFNAAPAELIDQLPALEIIANFGVGYDGVDTAAAAKRNIIVTNTPDVLNDEVADTTIGLLLGTVRRLYDAEKWLRDGKWENEGPFALSPLSLRDRHVGLYGLGRIGLEIAKRLEPFKVKISYHTRSERKDVSYGYYSSLGELATAVDTLICIVPKTPETHKAIDADVLKALGPNGVMINVGRGWSVDEEALEAALKSGVIAAAGLDVFQDEPKVPAGLLDAPNLSVLPHIASASVPTRNAMADLVVANLVSWFTDGTVLTPVAETPAKTR